MPVRNKDFSYFLFTIQNPKELCGVGRRRVLQGESQNPVYSFTLPWTIIFSRTIIIIHAVPGLWRAGSKIEGLSRSSLVRGSALVCLARIYKFSPAPMYIHSHSVVYRLLLILYTEAWVFYGDLLTAMLLNLRCWHTYRVLAIPLRHVQYNHC